MLRITPITNAAQAKSYYRKADYYVGGEHELFGTWHGKAAARLDLGGDVKFKAWDALCDNLHPDTGKRLTVRTQKNRRVGYDFTFNVPKSISVLYALTQDSRLLEAFNRSVDEVMADIEADMKTRVRVAGADTDRVTGEAVWGKFIHFTSRPEDGIPDPHIHSHCVMLNNTWDSKEERFKAGQFGDLKRDGPYYEGLFHARLAQRVKELGLPLERTKTGYEIAGFDRSTVRKFSRRTERIEKLAAAKGITDPAAKGQLGAKTRNAKSNQLSMDQLAGVWRSWLTPEESQNVVIARHRLEAQQTVFRDAPAAATKALSDSLQHHCERASVVPERRILARALKHAAGNASVATILDQHARLSLITGERDGQRVVTTREILDQERRLIDYARSGRGTCRPLAPSGYELADGELSASQRRAARQILASSDRVIILRGGAGVGKTRMMREVVAGVEAGGRHVYAFAPSADASRGVLRDEGFKQANTVSHLLVDERLHPTLRDQVIWIDEAGLVGVPTLDKVFDLANRVNARVILSGDKAQHGSVERGAALRLLESEAGLVPAELSEIRRQQGDYKRAVQALSEGRTADGFKQLEKLGWIHEVADDERYVRVAQDYADAVQAMGPKHPALIVCPTHREGAKVTVEVRQVLKAAGRINSAERAFTALVPSDLTEAERRDPLSYLPGDVVVFHQNAQGHTKGDRITVGPQTAPVDQADRFRVFHSGTIALAAGDDVRITANGRTKDGEHRLNNGSIHKVKGFTVKGDIQLANGWVIDKEFGHLAYGYVTTSHASQGKSPNRVFVVQSAESFAASSREQFYVSASRGKQRVDLYTDNAAELLEAIQRTDDRLSAIDLVNGREPARDLNHKRTPRAPVPAPSPDREWVPQ